MENVNELFEEKIKIIEGNKEELFDDLSAAYHNFYEAATRLVIDEESANLNFSTQSFIQDFTGELRDIVNQHIEK